MTKITTQFLTALVIFCFVKMTKTIQQKPNIIFYFADDVGWNDVSYNGMKEILTPNIDTLAGAGLILNNYYTQPSCTPSRSALLTGMYPIRLGTQHMPLAAGQVEGLPLNVKLISQYLKELSYDTHIVGKWHLGNSKKKYTPTYRGFDSHYGYWAGVVSFYQHTISVFQNSNAFINLPADMENRTIGLVGYDFHENLEPVKKDNGKHMAELITDRAVKIIETHDQKNPLFLYIAQLAVHASDMPIPSRSPKKFSSRFPYITTKLRKNFAGDLTLLDESVGTVMEALLKSNLLNNTIFVFSTDNGADLSLFSTGGSNYPLRGAKFSVFEGGIRGVGFVWSPLLSNLPRISNDLFHITDWMPTLINAAAGYRYNLSNIDGLNQWPMISKGEPGPRKEMLVNFDPVWNIGAYRDEDYKLVFGRNPQFNVDNWYGPSGLEQPTQNVFYDNKVQRVLQTFYQTKKTWKPNLEPILCNRTMPKIDPDQCKTSPCLFNIAEDPCEMNDISGTHLQKTKEMLQKIQRFKSEMVPAFSKQIDYNSNPLKHCGLWTTFLDVE